MPARLAPLVRHVGRTSVVALALSSLGLVLPTSASAATPIRCGSTITRTTTLSTDLTCAGSGLTLAPGVKLDLGGHLLQGDGTGTALSAQGSTSTQVRNGRIQGWALGIDFSGATPYPDSTLGLDRIAVTDAPLRLEAATTTLNRSTITRSLIRLYENDFHANGTTFDHSSTEGELNRVWVRNSYVFAAGLGVDENNSVSVYQTVLDGTGAPREAIGCFGPRVIERSVVRDYAVPMLTDFCPTRVDQSTFSSNPNGVFQAGGGTLTVSRSTFRDNGVAIQGAGVDVSGSTFTGNAAGVQLSGGYTEGDVSRVVSSTFDRNRGSGITSDGDAVELGDNLATRNGAYGINAPGATDLGGNRASGNKVADCVGVSCTR